MPVGTEEGQSDPIADSDGFVFGDSVSTAEERDAERYLPPTAGRMGETLADIILAKIREHEAKRDVTKGLPADRGLGPKVVEVYSKIGAFLAKYRSGKIPKAFKIIPRLRNWEEVLYLTDPVKWTPNAMYRAVKLFASNLNADMAQRFFNLVLLPAVREDIQQNKRLNFHYYQALKKALFKPGGWIKGILLPLVNDGCSLREAVIIGSVVSKVSIPAEHGAAALMRLCQSKPWYVTNSYFIGILINKKWALPTRVVEAAVDHFHSFANDDLSDLPVVWHRSLLSFVQRYKYELNEVSCSKIKEVLQHHCHSAIGKEIHRELSHAAQAGRIVGGDDWMRDVTATEMTACN